MKTYKVSFTRRLASGVESSITLEQKASEADEAVAILEQQMPGWTVLNVATA